MNRTYAPAFLIAAATLLVPAFAAAQYQVVATSTTRVRPLERTEWVVAPSPDPIETSIEPTVAEQANASQ